MEKQFVVLYQSYPNSTGARPTTLPQAAMYNFCAPGGTSQHSFPTEEAALTAIKGVNVQNAFGAGYAVVWSIAQLVAAVETKPVIETVVTRY